MQKLCPNSGIQFIPNRKNQVYATAKDRRDYHNNHAAELRKVKSPIDKVLEKNFILLSERLNQGESQTIAKEELLILGFNPNYFTHLKVFNGKTARCLYHFILPQSDNPNFITIIYPTND